MCLLTIITVTYNSAKTLEQTILSILNQTYKEIEYIIIDGGSTDGTIEIIKKYENKINFWQSEPDGGIFDAMNKALYHVKTEWVHYLNSDDTYFSSSTLEKVVPYLQNTKYDVIHGLMVAKRQDGSFKKIQSAKYLPNMASYQYCPIQQPAAFTRYDILMKYKFDSTLKITADYKLWVDILKNGGKVRFIDQIITLFSVGGMSSNLTGRNNEVLQIFRELHIPDILIILLHFNMFLVDFLRKHANSFYVFLHILFKR
jgi:glycosyltransferase involved in cell wall biosynthesis